MSAPKYRGRFAPSPTGPLHFGSMVAAVGSYLQARSQKGEWLVRIEDIDPPREAPGATHAILHTLEHFGLGWDGEVLYQSQRSGIYAEALEQLKRDDKTYYCRCSRSELAATAQIGEYGPIYPGTCRGADHHHGALRVMTDNNSITFVDAVQGRFNQQLASEVGDFVLRRADGLFAYQLAVVVDDAAQQITEIVRGRDLLDNTPRQIYLQQLLGFKTPCYIHLPIALNNKGQKLSKQNGAAAVDKTAIVALLIKVLEFLGQRPPQDLNDASLDELWRWAISHWQINPIPTAGRPVDSSAH